MGVGNDPEVRNAAQRLVDEAAGRARERIDGIEVQAEVVEAPPAKALVDESQRSSLVTVGRRGHGGFAALLLGSTSVGVVAQAACPVAVVPPEGETRSTPATGLSGSIVAGVDGSAGSDLALAFAFSRAAERKVGLVALYAWQLPTTYSAYAVSELLTTDSNQAEREARARLAGAVAPWQDRYPEVAVDQRTVLGHTVWALAEASAEGAQAVVVGSRGRGSLAGLVLGSVSQGVLRHAQCPVIVAR